MNLDPEKVAASPHTLFAQQRPADDESDVGEDDDVSEEKLDESVEETFPASDPISP